MYRRLLPACSNSLTENLMTSNAVVFILTWTCRSSIIIIHYTKPSNYVCYTEFKPWATYYYNFWHLTTSKISKMLHATKLLCKVWISSLMNILIYYDWKFYLLWQKITTIISNVAIRLLATSVHHIDIYTYLTRNLMTIKFNKTWQYCEYTYNYNTLSPFLTLTVVPLAKPVSYPA